MPDATAIKLLESLVKMNKVIKAEKQVSEELKGEVPTTPPGGKVPLAHR